MNERAQQMADLYRAGFTMEQCGYQFDVTRERARQILKSIGITSKDGGAAVKRAEREAEPHDMTNLFAQRHGIDESLWRELVSNGATLAWREQRRNCLNRAIPWHLGLGQWWSIWEASGKWSQRGRHKNSYVLSRIGNKGAYEVGNVHVVTLAECSRSTVALWAGKDKANPGVFNLYPGTPKPFKAQLGKKSLGFYATEGEAVFARDRALERAAIGEAA